MMAFLAANRAVFPVKKYALADVDLHIAFRCLAGFTSTVAERALRLGYLDNPLSSTYLTVFRLHHTRYSITSLI